MAPFPTMDQYQEAVQFPKTAFFDQTLKSARVRVNGLGLPATIGGGFALTYQLITGSNLYAVRCFHKSPSDLEARYHTITSALRPLQCASFVAFEFQKDGISVGGKIYPIVKMDWISGETLGEFLESNFRSAQKIEDLRHQFVELERVLRGYGIAHGDLQNGNVLISPNIRLVDYDGLYVPSMRNLRGSELGHRHFQHPARSADNFGPSIDRFSFIVIYVSLLLIEENFAVFKTYFKGENILFEASDYRNPLTATIFNDLFNATKHRRLVEDFAYVCLSPVELIPSLDDFLNGKNIPRRPIRLGQSAASPTIPVRQPYVAAFEIVLPGELYTAKSRSGRNVEVIGLVSDIHKGRKAVGGYYLNVYFSGGEEIRVTFWNAKEDAVKWIVGNCCRHWVSLQGLVGSNVSEMGHSIPVMTLMSVAQFRRLDQLEFNRRLDAKNVSKQPSASRAPGTPVPAPGKATGSGAGLLTTLSPPLPWVAPAGTSPVGPSARPSSLGPPASPAPAAAALVAARRNRKRAQFFLGQIGQLGGKIWRGVAPAGASAYEFAKRHATAEPGKAWLIGIVILYAFLWMVFR